MAPCYVVIIRRSEATDGYIGGVNKNYTLGYGQRIKYMVVQNIILQYRLHYLYSRV
jgi:hypothetical protein